MPSNYKTSDGYKLGIWVSTQRRGREQLAAKYISQLELLPGWGWDPLEFQWDQGYSYLEKYVQQQGHARVPSTYKTEDEYYLGRWVRTQRKQIEQLTPERLSKLESLESWVWDPLEFNWEEGFAYLKQYVQQHGHSRIPYKYKVADGFNLGRWAARQRRNKVQLTAERILKLDSISFDWVV
ncbi:hypothetical protein AU255_06860 [Methyloprofundus sedimenti]|uniref:Helicase-associated domain-containing protein n=1 Tax=Methyloprofundus sedimenti TaxID=1420851 RepID=A0A1V8M7R2_9GAMM|nr:hypothetical protein AU255_06860 [Methyloprofundus sedimenti]